MLLFDVMVVVLFDVVGDVMVVVMFDVVSVVWWCCGDGGG